MTTPRYIKQSSGSPQMLKLEPSVEKKEVKLDNLRRDKIRILAQVMRQKGLPNA